jgi:hypothetical protein
MMLLGDGPGIGLGSGVRGRTFEKVIITDSPMLPGTS